MCSCRWTRTTVSPLISLLHLVIGKGALYQLSYAAGYRRHYRLR